MTLPDARIPGRMSAALVVLVPLLGLTAGPRAGYQPPDGSERPATRPAPADERPAPGELPATDELLERMVEALGGRQAHARIRNRVISGTVEMPTQGIRGSFRKIEAAPSRSRQVLETETLGQAEAGSDGQVFWELNPTTGPRVLQGAEKAAALRQATFHAQMRWKDLFKSIEVAGIEEVEGRPAYKVVLTPSTGAREICFVDRASFLPVKLRTTEKGPAGDLEVETLLDRYERVDGIMIPRRSRQRVMGLEMVTTVEKVEHNVDLPADAFEPPPAVRELLQQDAAKSRPQSPGDPSPSRPDRP